MNSCHFHGFSVVGTLMHSDGHTPAAGATVTIIDHDHRPRSSTTIATMTDHETKGGCNASDCHGASQGIAHLWCARVSSPDAAAGDHG